MTKSPTKSTKLRWLRNARIGFENGVSSFTCNVMNFAQHSVRGGGLTLTTRGGNRAEKWYADTSAKFKGGGESFGTTDFSDNYTTTVNERWEHRALWLAMLETLVEAGEDNKVA